MFIAPEVSVQWMIDPSPFIRVLRLSLVAITVIACTPSPPQETAQAKRVTRAHLVESVVAHKDRLRATQVRTGTLRARRTARIFNQEEGRITRMPLYESDPVTRGGLLVEMDGELLRAQLDKALASLRQVEIDLKRTRELNSRRLSSDDELARAQTAVEIAKAEATLLRTRHGYMEIRAPFSGVVSERLAEPEDIVPAHTHLMSLVDPQSLVTELPVGELLLPHVKKGDTVVVRIDALGNRQFSGVVLRIHPTLDPRTRRGLVEIALEPVPAGARAGQFCRVSLRTPALERLTVPLRALQHDPQGEFVFRIDDTNKARRVAVRSGLKLGERVEILEGLEDGDHVVTKGFLGLRADTQVASVTPISERLNAQDPGALEPDR